MSDAPMSHTESTMFDLLCQKYSGDDWVCIPQVPSGTGLDKKTTADAVAMSLWPSRGLELHGFEIKVSRSDWLAELKKPAKAESISRYCDRWWLVADKGVANKDELPKGWGLLVPHGNGLRSVVTAELTDAEPMTRSILAGLLRASDKFRERRVRQETNADDLAKKLGAKFQAGVEHGKATAERKAKFELEQAANLKQAVADFEAATGLRIAGYRPNGERLGEQVVAAQRLLNSVSSLRGMRNQLAELLAGIDTLTEAATAAITRKDAE